MRKLKIQTHVVIAQRYIAIRSRARPSYSPIQASQSVTLQYGHADTRCSELAEETFALEHGREGILVASCRMKWKNISQTQDVQQEGECLCGKFQINVRTQTEPFQQ